jgi:hypothetical protein
MPCLVAGTNFRDIVRHPAWLLTLLAGILLIAAGPILDLPGLAFPSGDRLGQAGALFLLELGLDAAQLLLAAGAAVGGAIVSRRLEQGCLAPQFLAPAPKPLILLSQGLAVLAASFLAGAAGLLGAGLAAWLASPDPAGLFAGLAIGPVEGLCRLLSLSLFLAPLMLAAGFAASPGGVARFALILFLLDFSFNLAFRLGSGPYRLLRILVPDFGLFSLSGALYGQAGLPGLGLLHGLGGGLFWFGLALLAWERFGRDRA